MSTTMSPCILQQQQAYTGMCKSRDSQGALASCDQLATILQTGHNNKTKHNTTQHNTTLLLLLLLLSLFFVGIGGTRRWHQTPFVKSLFYCLLALRGQRQRPAVRQGRSNGDNHEHAVHSARVTHFMAQFHSSKQQKARFHLRPARCALRHLSEKTSESSRAGWLTATLRSGWV